ncbi:hypothetical protein PGQ11_006049 [Apiospora arundinis]|uniref:F-box domain-containing protein n=1 Tax=Apiospora arundinis TaxID=335852 RepID=A0ABR2IRJ7_9PEZI
MLLLQLPTELVLDIVARVDSPSDLLHLAQTCRQLSPFFLEELYTRDVQYWNSSALLWASQHGKLATARRSLAAGALVDHLFFESPLDDYMDPSNWAPWLKRDTVDCCLAGHPLAIAVQYRQTAMVRFLLEEAEADPNQHDGEALMHSSHAWYPLHWALTCQTMQRRSKDDIDITTAATMTQTTRIIAHLNPPELIIIALLLRHGANPTQYTTEAPHRCFAKIGGCHRYFGESHDQDCLAYDVALRPVNFAGCDRVPVAALQLLLEHGADPHARSSVWPCAAPHRIGRGLYVPNAFEYLRPLWPFVSETHEAKLLLVARHETKNPGRRRWRLDLGLVRATLHVLTASRLRLWLFLTREGEPFSVLGSGVYAALDAWARQKAVAVEAAAMAKDSGMLLFSEEARLQAEILELLESLIVRLVGVKRIEYADEAVLIEREEQWEAAKNSVPESGSAADAAAPIVGLPEAFRSFCEKAGDSNDISPFVAVLVQYGIHAEHKGRQLTLSEAIERRLAPRARSLLREWPMVLISGGPGENQYWANSDGVVRLHRRYWDD